MTNLILTMEANLLLCSVAMVVAAIFINLNTTQLQESSSKRKKKDCQILVHG